ncbi:hypothetical protein K493DRAFT_362475 [Basidiobolus meristosporus CBS 931.73]|uniref:Transmembrane protein 198 n=1 Tax=Basidiobolus meristosporus CBS 931.73 TaxID=1314790 RepID=A0A1Y1X1W9_9FUNG|nr:hypothetical protein K493DRAFT_362475 [Basidiobolus meristosporus CBS 931.73]|eukprot:ORX79799.1 hypothetical protein K493DRAFT_362475 [Basidiobolus meristosporus CBS 931.73]
MPMALAQDPVNDDQELNQTQKIIAGVLLILIGFAFCFFGRRLVKVTIFLTGFVFFSGLALVICANISPVDSSNTAKSWIYIAVSIVSGLIGGYLLICLFQVGLVIIGGLGGFALSMIILSLKENMLITSNTGRIIFIVVFVVIGAISILFLERHILIWSSAIYGSYTMVVGVDVFVKTGMYYSLNLFFRGHAEVFYHTNAKVYAMLGSAAVAACLGALFQYKTTSEKF